MFGSPIVRPDGGKYSAPPRHWSGAATKPDHLVEGFYRRTHECAGWGRLLHGGSAHLARAGDLLCVVLPSSGKPPGQRGGYHETSGSGVDGTNRPQRNP